MPVDMKEKIKLKIGEEDQEISIEDLTKGFMLQSDYTKKTQELSDKEKEFGDKNTASETSLKERNDEIKKWNDWWKETGQYLQNPGTKTPASKVPSGDDDDDSEIDDGIKSYINDAISAAGGSIIEDNKNLKTELQKAQRHLRYMDDMQGLFFGHHVKEHKDLPFRYKELQDIALKKGKVDLTPEDWEGYYKEAYSDEYAEQVAATKLKEKEDALNDKKEADKVNMGKDGPGTGSEGKIFKLPESAPGTMGEAEQGAADIFKNAAQNR